jgi:rubrerythrin
MVFERQVLSLALVEKELFELYTNLLKRIEDVTPKTLLSYIATDSLKHSTILAAIIEEVDGSKAKESDCDVTILYNKGLIRTLSKDIAVRPVISNDELISLIGTLAGFENLLFTEYKKAFHLEFSGVKKYGSNQSKEEDENLNIFTLIVDDEERHQRILGEMAVLCDRKLSFKRNAPVVKYQSPDSWYVPPQGHRR